MQVGEGARHELLERIPAPARVVEPHKDGPVAPVRVQEVDGDEAAAKAAANEALAAALARGDETAVAAVASGDEVAAAVADAAAVAVAAAVAESEALAARRE